MLHPLKLTSFEEYMLCDDRPDYPMTGFFRLRFSGKLSFQAMDSAIQSVTARHPLLRSRVRLDTKQGHCWATDESIPISLERWSADSQSEYPFAAHMDLTRTAGTRIWLVDHETGSDLVAQMHHACTDALGMCQFIEDLLISYAGNVGELSKGVELRPLDTKLLPRRNQFGLTWGKLVRMLPRQILGLHIVGKYFARKAAPLGLLSGDQSQLQPHAFPSPCAFNFDSQVTSRVLAEARRRNVTVNDLLARDLFLAIHDWRTQHGVKSENEWLRFFVPINQRTADDVSLPAANIMSAVFLERNCHHLTNAESLLQSIQAEMQINKHRRYGFIFIAAHALMKRIPCLRNHVIRRGKCVSSCVFSNLGVILSRTPMARHDGRLAIGNNVLEEVNFIAPLRPLTAAAFCIHTYAGRLAINLHFDPRSISKLQADELLDTFVRKIHESLKSVDQKPTPLPTPPTTPTFTLSEILSER